MDIPFENACVRLGGIRKGYVLVFKGNNSEVMWTHARNLKRLIKVIKKMQKQGREFKIYNCYNEKEMDEKKMECVMGIINKHEKEVLQLDD